MSTLLGAGAFALPQLKHAHFHEKKDVVFYSQWQEGPHTLIQEYVNENVVVGNAPAPAQTSAVVAVKANYAFPHGGGGQHSWAHEAGKQYQQAAVPKTTAPSPSSTPLAVSSTPLAPAVVYATPIDSPPAASSTPAVKSSGSEDTTAGTSTGACNPTDGDAWTSPPCTGSNGASALDKINNLRTSWNSSLAKYEWNPTLAQNAYKTAWLATTWTEGRDSNGNPTYTPNGEGGGWVMGHHLFDGSNGQCIAEGNNTQSNGDLTPIEVMFLMWICEKPSDAISSMCTTIGSTGGDPNCACPDPKQPCSCGHALIIQDTGMNSIGCYFLNAVAESKTDNAFNAAEQAQELGTKGNSAPGMLTCDFTG